MDDAQEQDQYEERLKEVFNGFDASGTGSLSPEELSDLCQSLHLGDATPALLQALLQNEDHLTGRVDFDQFKNALIVVLSSSIEAPQPQQEEDLPKPDSPVIQPKFVKGSKRYGRRSTPEFIEPVSDFTEVTNVNPVQGEEDPEEDYSAVPRKRERWNALETNTEEYEAEGQMHLWNPDEPSTPRGSIVPLSEQLEGRIREACDKLALPWDGCASYNELLGLCDHLGLDVTGDVVQSLSGDGAMTVQEFVTRVVNHSTPLTPSASTSYRQFKRLHSTQPFDEVGRRTVTPSAMTGTIGMRLFSTLDDGTGYIPVEYILDAWMEEGIENSTEILQALDFSLDGKLNLCELTMALENELLVTKNGIHQAALASFKAEIRHLLERVDRELREKEKLRSDLDKAEKLKSQLAVEVDEHHSAIERMNNLNLRKLEQDHKEKVAAVRSELIKEMDQIQQQAGLQREELEAEIEKIRGDETFLRDHLSISVKENRRIEMELLDSTEKLVEAHNQNAKLQEHLDKIVKEKFGDLDPGSADFLLQEERIKQLRSSFEVQCRELQDRIDELQSELQEFHSLGRVPQLCSKPLSEELESKSPGMESDPGLGSEDGQPFNMTLEAELMLEHLKEQHLREVEDLRVQLESKVNGFDLMVQGQLAAHEEQKAAITLRYQEEVHALKEEIAGIQNHERELRKQLEQMELERADLQQKQAGERKELENLQAEEAANLSQRLLEAHTHIADLEEQLKSLEFHQAETEVNMDTEMERLKERHALALNKTDEEHEELLKDALEEQRTKLLEERANMQTRLLEDWEREKEQLQKGHEEELKVRLEEVSMRFRGEHEELQRKLTEEWKKERVQMKEQSNEAMQAELEEGIQRLLKEQKEKEKKIKEEWETELSELQEVHEDTMHTRLTEERLKQEQREGRLREEWEGEKLHLEESYERMLQDQLKEEREKLEAERKEAERRLEELMEEEKARLQESHHVAMRELTTKHSEERERLGGMLDQLREDIAVERRELENHFTKKIKDVEVRFSGEQESVTDRFQADLLKLKQYYQSELKTLSENHTEQKHKWETEMEMFLQEAEEQKTLMREAMEQERAAVSQERENEQEERERNHKKEMEALVTRNKELQNELEDLISSTQTKEIELSRHLNGLHNRLQDSLKTKDELLAQSDRNALEAELLLNQAVEDFQQERAELQLSLSELNAKYKEALSISEKQVEEGIDLLSERDDFKMKIEELEILLKQAAMDFDLERQELLENISVLEDKLMDNLSCCEMQENERVALIAERDLLSIKINEIEYELNKYLSTASESAENQRQDEDTEMITDTPDLIEEGPENTDCAEEQSENEACAGGGSAGDKAWESCFGTLVEAKHPHEEDLCLPSDGHVPQDTVPEKHNVNAEDEEDVVENKDNGSSSALPQVLENENTGEDVVDCENHVAHESGVMDNKPQDGPAEEDECSSHNLEPYNETAVESSAPEATGEPDKLILENAKMNCLPGNSHNQGIEIELLGEEERDSSEAADEQNDYSPESLEPQNLNGPCEQLACSLGTLQTLYSNAIEESILLHHKTDLLQQKTITLENILAHSSEKIKAGNHALEENYNLKVKMLLIMEQTKELEIKALRMAGLQLKYEASIKENDKLKEQNCELEERVLDLESRMHIVHEFQDQQIVLVNEIAMVREENSKLSELVTELERHNEILMAMPQDPASRSSETPADDSYQDPNCPIEAKIQEVADLEDCCVEFEKQNGKLRNALTELQGKSLTLTERMQAHGTETNRLAEENHVLQHKLATLKEEDLKEAYGDLQQKLERLKKEKMAAQKMAETLKKQISGLYLRSQQLEEENALLSETNAQKAASVETLSQQLAELIKETERRESVPAEERTQMAACVSALEADLTKALEDTVHLEGRNSQLTHQLCALREKVQTVDETVQLVNLQNARLKSDLRVIQQEKDALRQEVLSLHKQLQNANDKNHVLEMTLNSSGFQSQHKKLFREKIARLQEQEQQLLKQENERLQVEVCNTKGELGHSRDKVRQLEATIVSLKQQKQQVKALEQENAALKQELEDKKELTKFLCENGEGNVESLQQENEALKAQIAHLSSQLLETLQSQFVGMLPPSPHRVPRGQHRGDDDNMQGERERKMRNMEERLKEIELSLHNVKLLLKEKVVQLKDQLHKNGKADVLIKDLYVENDHLLKTLDMTEQRHKIAVKKNYLLEEKISSLNKILRDLNPSPLPTTPYY